MSNHATQSRKSQNCPKHLQIRNHARSRLLTQSRPNHANHDDSQKSCKYAITEAITSITLTINHETVCYVSNTGRSDGRGGWLEVGRGPNVSCDAYADNDTRTDSDRVRASLRSAPATEVEGHTDRGAQAVPRTLLRPRITEQGVHARRHPLLSHPNAALDWRLR